MTITFFPVRSGGNSRKKQLKDKYSAATDNIAQFEALLCGKAIELYLPDGYYYTSILQTISAAEFDGSGEHDVTYTFAAVRHKPQVTDNVSPGKSIYCSGTTVSPCKIVVDFPTAQESVTIKGISVNNITANGKLVIDGIDGLITFNGTNKFNDSDLFDFPTLAPGNNVIDCTADDADITVTYTPIFI